MRCSNPRGERRLLPFPENRTPQGAAPVCEPFDEHWFELLHKPMREAIRELLFSLTEDTRRDFSEAPIARFMRETTARERGQLYQLIINGPRARKPRRRIVPVARTAKCTADLSSRAWRSSPWASPSP